MTGTVENPEAADVDAGPQLDLVQLVVFGIARSRWWVGAAVVLGGLLGFFAGAAKVNTYASQAKLLLIVGEREKITPESIVATGQSTREAMPTVTDEIQMLHDAAVYEDAARSIGAAEVLSVPEPTVFDDEDTPLPTRLMHQLQVFLWRDSGHGTGDSPAPALPLATKVLMASTSLVAVPGSHIILLTHTANSPGRAQEFASEIVAAYIRRHRSEFSITPYLEDIRGRLAEVRGRRDAARSSLDAHLSECAFASIEVQGPALIAEIASLDQELFAARIELEGIDVEQPKLAEHLEGMEAETEVVTPAVRRPNTKYQAELALLGNLRADKLGLRVQNLPLEELRRRESEYDLEIQRVEKTLEGIEAQVVDVPEQRNASTNPEFTRLQARIEDLEIRRSVLVKKIEKLDQRLEDRVAMTDQLRICEPLHEDLVAKLEEEQARYEALLQRSSTLEGLAAIDAEGESNLRVLQEATLEPNKEGPNRAKILMAGLVAGALAGVAFATIRNLLDPKVRYPQSLEARLGVPLIAVLPHTRVVR